jgi:hypothetical protein
LRALGRTRQACRRCTWWWTMRSCQRRGEAYCKACSTGC